MPFLLVLLAVLRVLRTLLDNLTARGVKNDRPVLLCSQLLEHEEVTKTNLMSYEKCRPSPLQARFPIDISEADCSDTPCVRPQLNLTRNLAQEWPEGFRNWKESQCRRPNHFAEVVRGNLFLDPAILGLPFLEGGVDLNHLISAFHRRVLKQNND